MIVYAAIDIHKRAFQAAVLDAESGEVVEERFPADRESLGRWAEQGRCRGRCFRESGQGRGHSSGIRRGGRSSLVA